MINKLHVPVLHTNTITTSNIYYPKDIVETAVNRIIQRVHKGELCGELNHPISKDYSRQLTVLYKECSHIIWDLKFEDDILYADIEIMKSPNGKILQSLIETNIPVKFSMRSIGNTYVKRMKNSDGIEIDTNVVQSPLHLITFDCVSNFNDCV